MQPELADALFIDEGHRYTVTEVVRVTGLTLADLTVLVECGAIVPYGAAVAQWTFSAWSVDVARRARTLRDEFAIDDVHAVAVIVRFEQRMRTLEREIAALRARLG
jgi:hypothetical protein